MLIGGLIKFSLIDFSGRIAAVIFTQGCNFRCPFCHNTNLVLPDYFEEAIQEEEILSFLKSRQGKLEAVVITGGEPAIQPDLISFLKKIKEMDYAIKLDTNGTKPEILQEIIDQKLCDYIAMDVKAPFEKYKLLAGCDVNVGHIKKSIEAIIFSGIDHEFRTTFVKPLLTKEDLDVIRTQIKGAKRYNVQQFVGHDTVLSRGVSLDDHYTQEEIEMYEGIWGVSPTRLDEDMNLTI